MKPAEVPLPLEQLLWKGRPAFPYPCRARYLLTDLRLVRIEGDRVAEVALYDIGDIRCAESRLGGLIGVSTITVHPRRGEAPSR